MAADGMRYHPPKYKKEGYQMKKTKKENDVPLDDLAVKQLVGYDKSCAEVDGRPTFLEVLVTYFPDISKNWNRNTQIQYLKHYREHIVPLLSERCLVDYNTVEDYDAVIDSLRNKRKERMAGNSLQYSASTIQHYRRLIKVVLEAAAREGICPDILWGSVYSLPGKESPEKRLQKERLTLRKSLEPAEEWRMAEYLMSDFGEDGQRVGLLLMAALGLRNEESCGTNYEDVLQSVDHPDMYCIGVYKSTTGSSNELKAGGKTRNMVRTLPLPERVCQFLLRRKEYLQSLVDSGELVLGEEYQSVDELPIVCLGKNWTHRCSSAQLTNAGRKMFQEIQLSEDQLAYIAEELEQVEAQRGLGRYKDPTAYLLRRNLATHLRILGFDDGQIQYFMGHDMESTLLRRGDFQHQEQQYRMKEKLELRAIFGSEWDKKKVLELGPTQQLRLKNTVGEEVVLPCRGNSIIIEAHSAEPGQVVEVKLWMEGKEDSDIPYHAQVFTSQAEYSRWVNVLKPYYSRYRRTRSALKRAEGKGTAAESVAAEEGRQIAEGA